MPLNFAACQSSGVGRQLLNVPAQGSEETGLQRGFRAITHWCEGVFGAVGQYFRSVSGHFIAVNFHSSSVSGDFLSVGDHCNNVNCHYGGVSRDFENVRGRCDDVTGNLGNVKGDLRDVSPDFAEAISH